MVARSLTDHEECRQRYRENSIPQGSWPIWPPAKLERQGPGKTGFGERAISSQSLTHRSRLVTGNSASQKEPVEKEEVVRLRNEHLQRAHESKQQQRDQEQGGRNRNKALSVWTLSGLGLLAGMGILVFGVLVMLGFLSPLENSGPQSAWASTSEGKEVTYGSVIKLQHDRTKYRLHSHEVPYGTGSGQQSVTGFSGGEDSNSYWVVKPVPGSGVKQGDLVTDGSIIRLFHTRTKKWLHSHHHSSPMSGNYEVSAFGARDQSDSGDHWKLIIERGKVWLRDQKVRLLHVDTGGYLHSHDKKYSRIVAGQQEEIDRLHVAAFVPGPSVPAEAIRLLLKNCHLLLEQPHVLCGISDKEVISVRKECHVPLAGEDVVTEQLMDSFAHVFRHGKRSIDLVGLC